MDAGPLGKIYVVTAGAVTVTLSDGTAATLGVMDSCFIPPGEAREVRNASNDVASMIVIMPYPPKDPA
jgi:quercetin dioxygenase-like cupin family protein